MAQYEATLKPITVEQTIEILHSFGWGIGRERMCAGLEQGIFPFGFCIVDKQKNYTIFSAPLMRWIAERCGEEVVPEIPKEE